MATKAFGIGEQQEPRIDVNISRITYSRAINHLCCRKVEIEEKVRGSTINIYEVWSGIGCKCMCFSEIGAMLEDVPQGVYTVNVYEKGTVPGDGSEPMEERLIVSEQVVIK
jgi:hypothetical protein